MTRKTNGRGIPFQGFLSIKSTLSFSLPFIFSLTFLSIDAIPFFHQGNLWSPRFRPIIGHFFLLLLLLRNFFSFNIEWNLYSTGRFVSRISRSWIQYNIFYRKNTSENTSASPSSGFWINFGFSIESWGWRAYIIRWRIGRNGRSGL